MKRKSRNNRRDSTIVLTFEHDATVGQQNIFGHRSMPTAGTEHCESTQKKEGSYGKSTTRIHFQNTSEHQKIKQISIHINKIDT